MAAPLTFTFDRSAPYGGTSPQQRHRSNAGSPDLRIAFRSVFRLPDVCPLRTRAPPAGAVPRPAEQEKKIHKIYEISLACEQEIFLNVNARKSFNSRFACKTNSLMVTY